MGVGVLTCVTLGALVPLNETGKARWRREVMVSSVQVMLNFRIAGRGSYGSRSEESSVVEI